MNIRPITKVPYITIHEDDAKRVNGMTLYRITSSKTRDGGAPDIGRHVYAAKSVYIGGGCVIGDLCVLGEKVELGKGCKLGDWCSLERGCKLGDWCVLGSGCRLGHDCILGNNTNLRHGTNLYQTDAVTAEVMARHMLGLGTDE